MPTWSFYDKKTGFFTGRRFNCRLEEDMLLNIPNGCASKPGDHDHRTKKINLKTGNVILRRPPLPAEDPKDLAQQRITSLERQQLRPLRELAMDPNDTVARDRLKKINNSIKKHRKILF